MNTVTRRAEAIASRAYARRKKFQKSMTHSYSRSHDNLIELQEDDEDEFMRKDRLKFPSDYNIDSAYYEMLGNKDEALRTLRGLIRASREVERGAVVTQEKEGELEGSLSEPELYQGTRIVAWSGREGEAIEGGGRGREEKGREEGNRSMPHLHASFIKAHINCTTGKSLVSFTSMAGLNQ